MFLQFTQHRPSPEVFRLWAAIHGIGAAAERRVWFEFGDLACYPNLYVFLVGPPGTGKSIALSPVGALLRKSQAVTLAPNDMTKQGLLDALTKCGKGALINGIPFDYHFMAINISELSNFMSQYDPALAGILTQLYDCEDANEEKKRGHDLGKLINNPGLSMIAGTATQNLGNTISDAMWGSGFMARVIMVYSADAVVPSRETMFEKVPQNAALVLEIETGLRRIGEMKGPMSIAPGAADALYLFRAMKDEGAPIHNRLVNYNTRRWIHLSKLCMISALADERMHIEEEDFTIARSWLLAAEARMPEIFLDMVSHADGAIYEELRSYLFALHGAGGRRPLTSAVIYEFLSKRVASHAVERMVQVALSADFIRRVAGTDGMDALYVPTMPGGRASARVI